MSKLHIRNLSLGFMAAKLYKSLHCQEKSDRIINFFDNHRAIDDISLNCFYSVIKHRQPDEQVQILIAIDFLNLVAGWLFQNQAAMNGLQRSLSSRSHKQIIELMDIIINSAAESPDLMDQFLMISKKILSCFYKIIERSDDIDLRGKYLDCISKIFRIDPKIFNVNIYAQMLSINIEKIDQFYQLFDFYLLQKQKQQTNTVKFLLQGFSKRMKMFSQKNILNNLEKRGIIKAYLKLMDYLKNQINSSLPQKILNEHSQIYEYAKKFVNRQFDHHELSKIFNSLAYVTMNSKINNIYKFQFVLSLYKYILTKSASLFSFLCTDFLAVDEFLIWFVETELSYNKGKQLLQVYLKNCQSLQFLLVMAIYYLSTFPKHSQKIASYMKWIGLLQQSKCYFSSEAIKDYFKVFYSLTNDLQYFQDYLNRIQDITHRLEV